MMVEECDRLRVTETLVNLTEKSRDGNPVANWLGPQGLPPNILPTSGVVLNVHDPLSLMNTFETRTPVDRAAQEAWNGVAPLLTGMLPTILGPCDLGDFAIHAKWELCEAKLYIYDKAFDGIDLTLPAFERIEELLAASLQRVEECQCEEDAGCFRCVRHPFEDLATDRKATAHMIQSLVNSTEREPLETTFRKESDRLGEEEESATCPICSFKADLEAKFCSNCGQKLEEK